MARSVAVATLLLLAVAAGAAHAASSSCASTVFGFETPLTGFAGSLDLPAPATPTCVALDGASVRTGYLVQHSDAAACCVERGVVIPGSGGSVCAVGCDGAVVVGSDYFVDAGSTDTCFRNCYETPTDVCISAPLFVGSSAASAGVVGLDPSDPLNLNPRKEYTLNTGNGLAAVYGLAVTTRRRSAGTPTLFCANKGVVAEVASQWVCNRNTCGDVVTGGYAIVGATPVAGGACYFDCFTESTCPSGYYGALCDQVVNNCAFPVCLYGGTCNNVVGAGTYTCTCAPGYTGANCETVIDNCASSPCANGGTCTNVIGDGTFTCACALGWSGATCESNIDDCVGNACENGATCVDGINNYTCTCASADYSGTYCEILPSPAFCANTDNLGAFSRVLSTTLTANGDYLTTAGSFSFYNISLCQAFGSCFFQNANEPYGFFTVPYGPYEPAHNQSAEPTRILPNVAWRLSSDEAVVVFGCTPPLARYFALTHYVVNTYRNGAWVKPFGSMGDSLNEHRMHTFDDAGTPSAASDTFGRNHATILSADPNTVADVSAALTAMGVPSINVLQIPASSWGANLPSPPAPNANIPIPLLRMGLTQFQDDFSLLLRIIKIANPSAGAAYAAAAPLAVLRVTRSSTAPARISPLPLYGPPTLIPRTTPAGTTAVNELTLAAARDYIVTALGALYSGSYTIGQFNYSQNLLGAEVDFGGICYGLGVSCNGDNRDTRYLATQGTALFTPLPTFNMVVGVNHHATGTAEFSNVVAYNAAGQVGILGVDDTQYSGSADAYLAGTPYAALSPYLFVYKFARSCGPTETFCAVIPSTGYPALANSAGGFFVTRAYVRPDTGVGSALSPPSLLPPVHLRFVLTPPTTAAPTTPAPTTAAPTTPPI